MARSSANQDDMLLLLFLAVQPARPQRVSPLLLEQPEAVLPLPLLYHGDEPHDEVERKQDPARPQQVYREEAEGELVGRPDRDHGDQVPQQQDDRERDGHRAAPGRAPAGGARALGVLRVAGSDQRHVHQLLLLLLFRLVLRPGHPHAVSAHAPRKPRSATRVVVARLWLVVVMVGR
uniref:Uncharacterized protein n=1 Tax=Zea mays TaxID=4577 RepID=B8A3S9_MAIZE|nr:unknown [Zea mays]